MKIFRTYKVSAVAFMAVLYIFMALFSQVFHSHKASFGTDFHSKKTEKSISKSVSGGDDSGCIWCHQILESATELPSVHFDLTISEVLFARQIFAYKARFGGVIPSSFYLRGPPAFSV